VAPSPDDFYPNCFPNAYKSPGRLCRFFVGKFVPQSDLDENQVKKDRALVLLRQLITAAFDENEDGISSEELLTCFRSFDQDGDGWVRQSN
jgi:Ca2+-binding EF-hand superfamily protein